MKKVIRSAFSERKPVNVPLSGEPSRTKQEFKDDVNINEIMARMRRGISPPAWMTSNTPRYGDFSDLPVSFQEAHEIMARGEAAFMGLPLEIRRYIDHDPRKIDQIPREMYEKFGLLKPSSEAGGPPSPAPKGSGSPAADPVSNELAGSKNAPKKGADKADQ